jgi:hypothetical protein
VARPAARSVRKQLGLVEDHVLVETAQRDLGCRDQRKFLAFDAIGIRLVATRREAGPLQDRIAREIGRDVRHVAAFGEEFDRKVLQGELEPRPVALQEVEAGTGDLAAALGVDDAEMVADRHVVARGKAELRMRHAVAVDLLVVLVVAPDRGFRVRHVGHAQQQGVGLFLQLVELCLQRLAPLAQLAAFLALLLDRQVLGRRERVGLALGVLQGLVGPTAFGLEFDEPGEVDVHAAIAAIGGDGVGIGEDEIAVEHAVPMRVGVADS